MPTNDNLEPNSASHPTEIHKFWLISSIPSIIYSLHERVEKKSQNVCLGHAEVVTKHFSHDKNAHVCLEFVS